uniref:DUF4258 domain-containing protein n=1 Tax=Candidatus Kentrum sp. LFY TaxID=2126342 RepID=A0A450UWU7_9GAMM|nr:MAG: protein of unknown function (DUF4258) [Candidatus Kentron sp. LFY]VFK00511.1 MAG: protein of unknown function (DUF4258) [Candidatus Kentron sp. LFY]
MPSEIHLPDIRRALIQGRMFWKKHALERMMERNISRHAVKQAILDGEIIEEYPADYPIPSMLMAVLEPEPLHVVLAWDGKRKTCHIITVYRPDLQYFEPDLVSRRNQ